MVAAKYSLCVGLWFRQQVVVSYLWPSGKLKKINNEKVIVPYQLLYELLYGTLTCIFFVCNCSASYI